MLVDTFLFSEPHESDVMHAKLNVESELVDHWVIVENAYTTKGEWKGVCATEVLSEPRFAPFLERVTLVSLARAFEQDYRPRVTERAKRRARIVLRSPHAKHYDERRWFFAEARQRLAAHDVVMEITGGRGKVVVTDADEMITSLPRLSEPVHLLRRRRFVFDYDNEDSRTPNPIVVADVGSSLDLMRGPHSGPTQEGVLEFSYCFSRESLRRKLETFAHADPGGEALDLALECNHAIVRAPRAEMPAGLWFRTVDPEQARLPPWILSHFAELKTNVVNPDYLEARRRRYGAQVGIA